MRTLIGPPFDRVVGLRIGRAAIRLSARSWTSAAPTRRAKRGTTNGFDVYTFVTDEDHYEAMLASFRVAGMSPALARFVRLSGDGGNDPFGAIGRLFAAAADRYAILCHQDVRLDQGMGANELLSALAHLDSLDPSWVVAGNAGVTHDLRLVRRLVDPYGGRTADALPARVMSLDENFLVFNPRWSPHCSQSLSGFHFYGADVCLNAAADGGTAYVIDFPLTHLSAGRFDDAYKETRQRLQDASSNRPALKCVSGKSMT